MILDMTNALTKRECYERAARLQIAGQSVCLSLAHRVNYQKQAYALQAAGLMK